jgi:hypothetical protein
MRVKLFWKTDPLGPRKVWSFSEARAEPADRAKALEDQINSWLADHSGIRVMEVKQSTSGGSYSPTLWLFSVWYEEGTEPPVGAS